MRRRQVAKSADGGGLGHQDVGRCLAGASPAAAAVGSAREGTAPGEAGAGSRRPALRGVIEETGPPPHSRAQRRGRRPGHTPKLEQLGLGVGRNLLSPGSRAGPGGPPGSLSVEGFERANGVKPSATWSEPRAGLALSRGWGRDPRGPFPALGCMILQSKILFRCLTLICPICKMIQEVFAHEETTAPLENLCFCKADTKGL